MINIDIKPEDLNAFVKEAFVTSILGEKFSAAINTALNEALTGWDSPVKKLAREAVIERLKVVMNEEPWKSKIHELIAKHLTVEFVDSLMSNALTKALQELRDR